MAHRNDPDYDDSTDSRNDAPSKKSLKEKHEKAHDLVQGAGFRLNHVEGPSSRTEPWSRFSVNCGKHDHTIVVDHSKNEASLYAAGDEEESDANPAHTGTLASVFKKLKGCGKADD